MKLAAIAVVCLMTLASCGSNSPTDVAVAELSAHPHAYDGKTVRARGIVRSFNQPLHYWLEDERVNRIGLSPNELISPHLDREVSIVGTFSFSRERGRRIEITRIEPFDAIR